LRDRPVHMRVHHAHEFINRFINRARARLYNDVCGSCGRELSSLSCVRAGARTQPPCPHPCARPHHRRAPLELELEREGKVVQRVRQSLPQREFASQKLIAYAIASGMFEEPRFVLRRARLSPVGGIWCVCIRHGVRVRACCVRVACVCVRACVRACVRVCVRARVFTNIPPPSIRAFSHLNSNQSRFRFTLRRRCPRSRCCEQQAYRR
jgi:hypothetical protein